MILTDAAGRPIPRPDRADYPNDVGYIRAYFAWKDKIAKVAVLAFNEGFRAEMRKQRGQ